VLHPRHNKGWQAKLHFFGKNTLVLDQRRRSSAPMSGTKRQQEINMALRLLAPGMPLEDAMLVKELAQRATFKALTPAVTAWLALTSHIRHTHTEYDALLDEGYERDSARFFVVDAMNDRLTQWGCSRSVADTDDQDNAQDEAPTRG
jgi:hypothetical protein